MNDLNTLFAHSLNLVDFPDAEQLWPAIPGGGGAYALCDADDRIILLASAQSLRRTIKHRLTAPPEEAGPTKRADLAAITRRIRWQPTHSRFEASLVYYRLARVLYPTSYRKLVAFGPAWFVHIDPAATLPRFSVTNRVYAVPGRYWGPIGKRGYASDVVAELEDLFDLCRYHDILDKSPNGQACAYFEMGKCPAPCDGSLTAELYRTDQVEPAREYLWGNRTEQIEQWRKDMEQAAADLAFERTAALKSRIDRAEKQPPPKLTLARDADDFCYLIVQRGRGTSWLKPFFVTRGHITDGEPVRRKDLPDALPTWRDTLTAQHRQEPAPLDPVQRAEQTWLVCRFLFQGDDTPGCYLHGGQLDPIETALPRIDEAIPPPRRRTEAELAASPSGDTMTRDEPASETENADVESHDADNSHPKPAQD